MINFVEKAYLACCYVTLIKKKKKKKKQMVRLRPKRSILVHFDPNLSFFGVIAALMDLRWSIFSFNIIRITNAQLLSPNLAQ